MGWAPRVGCPPGFWCTPMLTGTRGGGAGLSAMLGSRIDPYATAWDRGWIQGR